MKIEIGSRVEFVFNNSREISGVVTGVDIFTKTLWVSQNGKYPVDFHDSEISKLKLVST